MSRAFVSSMYKCAPVDVHYFDGTIACWLSLKQEFEDRDIRPEIYRAMVDDEGDLYLEKRHDKYAYENPEAQKNWHVVGHEWKPFAVKTDSIILGRHENRMPPSVLDSEERVKYWRISDA